MPKDYCRGPGPGLPVYWFHLLLFFPSFSVHSSFKFQQNSKNKSFLFAAYFFLALNLSNIFIWTVKNILNKSINFAHLIAKSQKDSYSSGCWVFARLLAHSQILHKWKWLEFILHFQVWPSAYHYCLTARGVLGLNLASSVKPARFPSCSTASSHSPKICLLD